MSSVSSSASVTSVNSTSIAQAAVDGVQSHAGVISGAVIGTIGGLGLLLVIMHLSRKILCSARAQDDFESADGNPWHREHNELQQPDHSPFKAIAPFASPRQSFSAPEVRQTPHPTPVYAIKLPQRPSTGHTVGSSFHSSKETLGTTPPVTWPSYDLLDNDRRSLEYIARQRQDPDRISRSS